MIPNGLKVATDEEKVDFVAVAAFEVGDFSVDGTELAVAAAFDCDLMDCMRRGKVQKRPQKRNPTFMVGLVFLDVVFLDVAFLEKRQDESGALRVQDLSCDDRGVKERESMTVMECLGKVSTEL